MCLGSRRLPPVSSLRAPRKHPPEISATGGVEAAWNLLNCFHRLSHRGDPQPISSSSPSRVKTRPPRNVVECQADIGHIPETIDHQMKLSPRLFHRLPLGTVLYPSIQVREIFLARIAEASMPSLDQPSTKRTHLSVICRLLSACRVPIV